MVAVVLLIPLAYLLGSFPSAAIVTGAAGRDVTKEGSGNPGASNTYRLLGWKAGLLVLALDMGKGALAAGAGIALEGHRGAWILGVAAVLGHVFPVTRHFRGGRGVATAGHPQVFLIHAKRLYLFQSAETRAHFTADPDAVRLSALEKWPDVQHDLIP